MNSTAYIYGINGPIVYVKGNHNFKNGEMVLVGKDRLVGEVIGLVTGKTTIQVYEDTGGLKPGDEVISTGAAISVTLAPGIIGNIFDGIERPLNEIAKQSGAFISKGVSVDPLDVSKMWDVHITVKPGDKVYGGTIIAEVPETRSVIHKSMVPPNLSGTVIKVAADGKYTIKDTIVTIIDDNGNEIELTLAQRWPIRVPRPTAKRYPSDRPLITGQRIIDTLFPISKGGTAAIPGGFGTGKTMTQHQLAKWCDADIIIYVGCGERGNEMTDVLEEFPALTDPRTGRPLMERVILIANTSNMPVAAREASIYTGITMAEYYRDMGYDVALMADSTSRWAEALREISGRLEEMPAEEGYPAYLPSRLAEFYERAGCVRTLGGQEASVTIIGAVSPPGGDFSEPVTENTKRFVTTFLALDKKLAYSRHYPAINYLTSYSGYITMLRDWYSENVAPDMLELRTKMIRLLQEEEKLNEIVQLVGEDVLPNDQALVMETARIIKKAFLQQNALHKEDTYTVIAKQYKMLKVIDTLYESALRCVKLGIPISTIKSQDIVQEVLRMKESVPNDRSELLDELSDRIVKVYSELSLKYE